ncbi:MAG: hypothetical protein M3O03_12365 [Pseudomonadota bacterium]|nr:hypothetical protein [Pseudomonadota bacterium]
MKLRRLAVGLFMAFCLAGCTEEGFRNGGRDMLGGVCKQSDHCTVNCPEGQEANSYGRCNPALPR